MRRRNDLIVSGRFLMRALYLCVAAASVLLAGCVSDQTPPPRVVYQEVKVPVAVGCVSGRPSPVEALKDVVSQPAWASMPTGAKAQAIRAQAGVRMNYEARLNASIAGCADAAGTSP